MVYDLNIRAYSFENQSKDMELSHIQIKALFLFDRKRQQDHIEKPK